MTPAELMNGAMSVEQQGIPVDWKGLCMKVFESANAKIIELEAAAKENNEWRAAARKLHVNINREIKKAQNKEGEEGASTE